jgi:hypothetical protein
MWKVGQLCPRDDIGFELVAIDAALEALQKQETELYTLL